VVVLLEAEAEHHGGLMMAEPMMALEIARMGFLWLVRGSGPGSEVFVRAVEAEDKNTPAVFDACWLGDPSGCPFFR